MHQFGLFLGHNIFTILISLRFIFNIWNELTVRADSFVTRNIPPTLIPTGLKYNPWRNKVIWNKRDINESNIPLILIPTYHPWRNRVIWNKRNISESNILATLMIPTRLKDNPCTCEIIWIKRSAGVATKVNLRNPLHGECFKRTQHSERNTQIRHISPVNPWPWVAKGNRQNPNCTGPVVSFFLIQTYALDVLK